MIPAITLSDGTLLVIVLILGGYVLFLLAIAVVGFRQFVRGRWVLGAALIGAVLAFALVPYGIDTVTKARLTAHLIANTLIPEVLPLESRRVLFISSGGTLCDGLCGDVVGLGVRADVFWVGLGADRAEGPPDNPILGILDPASSLTAIRLSAPDPDLDDQRFPEPAPDVPANGPFDIVIIDDTRAMIAYDAPSLLGMSLPPYAHPQTVRLVFMDWPDPYAGPPPGPPTFRSITAWLDVRPPALWPFFSDSPAVPRYLETAAQWASAICPLAGLPEARDAATHARLCDPDGPAGTLN